MAVSGGGDSVALSFMLRDLASELGAAVGAHSRQPRLRGADGDEDEAFCRALAARLGLPIEVRRVDVAGLARTRRISIEAAARLARYEWFRAAAERLGANLVATGHTADDQAETVLLRLLRGSGARGVSGIRIKRGMYVRPLLQCRRNALRAWLQDMGESWREDASNADIVYPGIASGTR